MDQDIYEEIANIKRSGQKAAVATIVSTRGSTPREVGTKMVIKGDGTILGSVGGGCAEAEIWQEAMNAIKAETPKMLHVDLTGREAEEGMICGGVMDIFIEPILGQPTAYIFGGGHISFFISRIAKMAGFRIAIIDDRASFANAERFPEADEIHAEEMQSVFPKLKINPASYIIIVTRGHQLDEVVLEWAVTTGAKYIGMIGSKKKNKTVFSHLMARGVSKDALDKVHAPIGLDIAAQTPEEIAVAIVAELIKVRRQG